MLIKCEKYKFSDGILSIRLWLDRYKIGNVNYRDAIDALSSDINTYLATGQPKNEALRCIIGTSDFYDLSWE